MERNGILELLSSYRPDNAHEIAMVRETRAFILQHENCLERSQQIGHITGSAWVIDPDREFVLLTHHLKLDRWLQLGGHADGDADILGVALREAIEESGMSEIRPVSSEIFDVDVHTIPARDGEPEHFHFDIRFLFEADRNRPLRITPESKALAWVRLSEVYQRTREESIRRMVAKTRRLRTSAIPKITPS